MCQFQLHTGVKRDEAPYNFDGVCPSTNVERHDKWIEHTGQLHFCYLKSERIVGLLWFARFEASLRNNDDNISQKARRGKHFEGDCQMRKLEGIKATYVNANAGLAIRISQNLWVVFCLKGTRRPLLTF